MSWEEWQEQGFKQLRAIIGRNQGCRERVLVAENGIWHIRAFSKRLTSFATAFPGTCVDVV